MKRLTFPLLALGLFVGVLIAIRLGSVPSDVKSATPGNSKEEVTRPPRALVVEPQESPAGSKGALPEVDVRVHAGKAKELFEATAQEDPMAYFYGIHYSSASSALSRHSYLPKHNDVLVPLFIECMLHPNCRAKSTIAEELGLSGDRRAVPALIRALDLVSDPGTSDRMIAALGRLGDERALEPIIGKLDSGDTGVTGLYALSSIGSPDAINYLHEVLKWHTSAHMREEAAICLGWTSDPAVSREALKHAWQHDSETRVRIFSACSLVNDRYDEGLFNAIVSHLGSANLGARRAAAECLSFRMPMTQRTIPHIIQILRDDDPQTSEVAWEALEKHLNDGTVTDTSLGDRWDEVADEYEVLWQKVKDDWPQG